MPKTAYITRNPVTPNQALWIDPDLCIGCNICVNVCRTDVFVPHAEKRKPPIVLHPDECWFCGNCVSDCPTEPTKAIRIEHPLNQRIGWVRKETGAHFRVGMKNPPPPNPKPPVGE